MVWPATSMSHARTHTARARVRGAALLGLWVGLAGGPAAAQPAGSGGAGAGRSALSVRLTPAPVGPGARASLPWSAESRSGLGLGLGLGVAAAVSLGLGVGLLVQHREGYAQFEAAPDNAGFVAAVSGSSAGAGLVGAGLGLGAVGLTSGLWWGRSPGRAKGRADDRSGGRSNAGKDARDRVLWAELAVGGGLALIGSAWYAREWQRVQRDLYDGNKDADMAGMAGGPDLKALHRETAASSIIGVGAGLMVGAGVALVTHTVVRRRAGRERGSARWGLAGGPGQIGLGVRGRF